MALTCERAVLFLQSSRDTWSTLKMWLKGSWGNSEPPLSKLLISVLAGLCCWLHKVEEYHGPLKWSEINAGLLGTWSHCRVKLRRRGSGNRGTSVPEGKEGVGCRNKESAAKMCEIWIFWKNPGLDYPRFLFVRFSCTAEIVWCIFVVFKARYLWRKHEGTNLLLNPSGAGTLPHCRVHFSSVCFCKQ